MKFNLSVADAVRAEMARQRITQAELAKALHLSQPAVARRLSGEVPFDLAELDATARVLKVRASRLVAEAERVRAGGGR
ncbi:helix-turn-helix domain-containing protein [Microbacterium trichothecenolyticum]